MNLKMDDRLARDGPRLWSINYSCKLLNAKPPTATMDHHQVTDVVETGIAGGSFLARYTPRAHLLAGGPANEPDHSTWVTTANRRQIHALPVGNHRYGLIQDDARGLLNEAGDDWAVVSLFAIATHTATPMPTLVIVLHAVSDLAIKTVEGEIIAFAHNSLPTTTQRIPSAADGKVKLNVLGHEQKTLAVTCQHIFPCFSDTLDGSSHAVLSPAPQQRRDELQHIQAQVEHIQGRDGDGHLGTACLGSGWGRTSSFGNTLGCALDWALVLVERERSASLDNDPSRWTHFFLDANQSRLLHGTRQVFKAGATTGNTAGTRVDEPVYARAKYIAPGGVIRVVESKERVVVSDADVFATNGDSGAAVRDLDGGIRGMLWGGIDGGQLHHDDVSVIPQCPNWPLKFSGVCFFTPIDALLEDIRTGIAALGGVAVADVALALP